MRAFSSSIFLVVNDVIFQVHDVVDVDGVFEFDVDVLPVAVVADADVAVLAEEGQVGGVKEALAAKEAVATGAGCCCINYGMPLKLRITMLL